MSMVSETTALIAEQLNDPDTQWSLGTFGGLAEFSRDPDEPVELNTDGLSAVTARGGIRLSPTAGLRPFASESIGRIGWTHRVSLCLPDDACAMHGRNVLTELGPDEAPLREADRGAILFDLGLDVRHADLCVRVGEQAVVAELRKCTGKAAFDPSNPAMRIILAASPHRVFMSRAGRAEVYQAIPAPGGKSPDGPHTHLLPKLLQHRRTHAATEPVPEGFVPCAHFYPKHPIKDAMGRERPFDGDCHRSFQGLLERFGAPDFTALKARVAELVDAGQGPDGLAVTPDRAARTAIRIALRQLKAAGPAPHALTQWLVAFDRADEEAADDDPLTLGH